MPSEQKKRIALEAVSRQKSITLIANENNTSRKFVRQQGRNLQVANDNVFDIDSPCNDDVIYDLPVTKVWIVQLVLALMLIGQVSYRNIIAILKDLLDYDISLGTLNNIFNTAVEKARAVNATEDLSNIEVTANVVDNLMNARGRR